MSNPAAVNSTLIDSRNGSHVRLWRLSAVPTFQDYWTGNFTPILWGFDTLEKADGINGHMKFQSLQGAQAMVAHDIFYSLAATTQPPSTVIVAPFT